MPSLRDRIFDTLLSRKLIRKEQLEEALAIQQAEGGNLQEILVERGLVNEADLLAAMSQGVGIPLINLSRLQLDPGLKGLISRELAVKNQMVPVSCIGQTLTVAMADPLNIFALETLAAMTGLTIHPLLATSREIRQAIDQYYGVGVEESLRQFTRKSDAVLVEVVGRPADETDAARLLKQTAEAPVVAYTKELLTMAVRRHASDILIEPRERSSRVRFRIDGVLQEGQAPPKPLHAAVVSRIKVMSDLNIAERRLPQDGHFSFRVDERFVDCRVSIIPSSFGGSVCLRILDKGEIKLDLHTLGFSETDLERLRACALRPHGMILATGPTGSGKTTTLYALLKLIDAPEKNLVTVEDPVEFRLEGINQVSAKPEIGLTFAKALRSILRQDPDVIMVGEIRDAETADMAIKSALTGHLVLSTLHTNSAAGSIVRLVNMGMEPFLVNSCLMVVIGQRLVRKTCVKCRETYRPPPGLAEKLGLLDKRGEPLELARGTGCRSCVQSGYAGREVIAETMLLSPEIRELVLRRAPQREIERVARAQGMKTLREQGLAKVMSHVTTLDEIFRTTIGETVEP
ncbi:MAG: Flp pilus assembly complex ATPase component TadA [Candidatus Omnitrophica bacterium]|nr:Flp pilus assembly complex ATPase component TadA [Candidatus Omnitrophota bacterium]MBI2495170.1 Flp pilus assembly complex ATPase component TadA [Candidatus Omnitrophota bacterium]MBI3021502.1 Flp pilus assembly complex ATPase component TadA [Candidatus Omnitrophota bacterium]MBI3084083.1 Flp pilus assembly complex ATPase component TadA [Candidatus Omnitrophota bacterium]